MILLHHLTLYWNAIAEPYSVTLAYFDLYHCIASLIASDFACPFTLDSDALCGCRGEETASNVELRLVLSILALTQASRDQTQIHA